MNPTPTIASGSSSYLTDLKNNLPVGTSSSYNQTGADVIAPPNQTSSAQPTISADQIGGATKMNIPDTSKSSGTSPAQNIISLSQAATNSFATDTQAKADAAQTNLENAQSTGKNLINAYLGKGADQLQQEQAMGVDLKRTYASQQSNLFNTAQINLNDQLNKILQNPALTAGQRQEAINATTAANAYNIANIGISASMAQNDYVNAQNIINHQIDVKYAPIKDAAEYYQSLASQNATLFTSAQQNALTAKAAALNQQYQQASYNDHLQKDTQVDMIKNAAAQGATPQVLQDMTNAMNSGKTIGEVAQLAGGFLKSSQYTIMQTGIDQETGFPIYSKVNEKTGQIEPLNYNGALGVSGSDDTIVNGTQLGATTTMGAYASNTATQVANVKATVGKIESTVGKITDATTAQAAIKAVAPKSPITGDMVMSAANKYGVDPATIIGVIQAETQSGTDGSKGSKENNWGNVGNTDSLMASGESVKMTPQGGLDAVASVLAKRQVQSGQIDPTQPPKGGNLTPQQVAVQTIATAPKLLQPAMGYALSSGATYIDSSKVEDRLKTMMNVYSSKYNIPVLDKDQVSIIKGADEAARNIVNIMSPAWNKVAPSGGIVSKVSAQADSLFQNSRDTDLNAQRKAFIENRENLAQQIRALSQSAPKGSLLSTAETALPDIGGYGNVGVLKEDMGLDSKKIGDAKMQKTLDLLTETMRTFLPSTPNIKLETPQVTQPATGSTGTLKGQVWVLGEDNLMHPQNQ